MKVSLLKPPIGGIIGLEMITFVEPLGLECVAGTLEERGHTCQIVDLRIDGGERGLKKMEAFGPEVVGIQCNFTTERFRAMRLAREVKRRCPDALLIIGGHDASRDPEWFMKPGVDVVAVGDGEEVIGGLVDAFATGKDLATVPGLVLNRESGPVDTGHAPARREIDELPMPARHLIAEYADEYYINFRRPLALLETARGCPFKCNFCSVWKFHESTFRTKSPGRVLREIEQIKAPNIFITDDIFWMDARRGHELADAFKAAGVRKHFTIQTRTDIICRFPNLIEKWRDCGRMTIFLGLEKIDDSGLKSVNKHNTVANNNRAIEILQSLGVGYTPNFIIDPDWERKDFENLKRWIDRTGAYNSGFSVLTPLPGTDLWESVKDQVNTEDWELFDICHAVLPTRMPLDEFYREYAGLWKHALGTRLRIEGKARCYFGLLLAIATRKVTFSAMRKGMRLGMDNVLARAETYHRAHVGSNQRLRDAAEILAPLAAAN